MAKYIRLPVDGLDTSVVLVLASAVGFDVPLSSCFMKILPRHNIYGLNMS